MYPRPETKPRTYSPPASPRPVPDFAKETRPRLGKYQGKARKYRIAHDGTAALSAGSPRERGRACPRGPPRPFRGGASGLAHGPGLRVAPGGPFRGEGFGGSPQGAADGQEFVPALPANGVPVEVAK